MVSIVLMILTVSLSSPALAADQYSPPRGMSIAGVPCYVVFRWPDDGSMYYLEVFASGISVYSKPVKGSSFTLSLPPNDYKWRIRKFYNGEYHEIMDFQNFSVSANIAFSYDGVQGYQGQSGAQGNRGWAGTDGRYGYASNGGRGGDGGNGNPGRDIQVKLEDAGDYLKVVITSNNDLKEIYLSKSSRPLSISSRGGRGGDGGNGGPGGIMEDFRQAGSSGYQNAPVPYLYGGSGGAGGNGGDGGNGGTVNVISRGGDFTKYIDSRVTGGEGGKGGPGGNGGDPGGQYGPAGRDGRTGGNGKTTLETQ